MAKRKVVKHSSKTKHAKKQVVHKEKIEEPQESQTSQAVVQESKAQPTQPQAQQPNIQPAVKTVDDKDSIFADDTPKETTIKVEKTNKFKSEGIFKKIIVVICCLLIILWIILMIVSVQRNTITKAIGRQVVTYEYVPAEISLAEYTNITNISYIDKVSLVGYLRLESVQVDKTTKISTRYLVDDKDRRIKLLLGYSEDKSYGQLFITNYTTDYTFTVSGTYKYGRIGGRDTFLIDVNSITSKDKPVVVIAVNTTIYDNVTKGNGYILNFTKGWNKITGK